MNLFKSFTACFSTYSRIPMPHVQLDSEDMKYSLIFFPAIGVVIGLLEYALFFLSDIFSIPKICLSLLAAAVPLIVTGGIHVDGYMDTMDALNSYGDKEKKLAIMKDPHTGGFAVIKLLTYGLIYIAFIYMLDEKSPLVYSLSFVISRTLSGLSVCALKGAKKEGMLFSLKEKTSERRVFIVLFIFLIFEMALLLFHNIFTGIFTIAAVSIIFLLYKKMCMKNFDGITGDTSGYYLCILELCLLIIAALEGFI